ncbi:YihY/virulence factor BrkB family protein [Synechococcus sp. 1G10]|uniref:YihY/virulence factor BrkB family protein n=1 Tax=Synechococcus sp. 1G10 TaxID=2025605 RepID=UPI000B9904B3|nr:YihY/virulence factor BrkB family protein [Synechococcus sp. 1G10]
MKLFLRRIWWSCRLWNHFGCVDLSAAFAYHTLQSFFPVLLIILSLASWVLGRDDGLTGQILDWTSQLLPDSAQRVVQSTLVQLYRQRGGAGFLGVAVLLITASNAYLSLQRGTDHLWSLRFERNARAGATVAPIPVVQNVLVVVRRFLMLRLKATMFLLSVGTLFVMDQLTVNLRLMGFETWRGLTAAPLAWLYRYLFPVSALADLLVSLLIASLVSLGLLRLLPSRRISWHLLLPGSMLVGSAYTLLNIAVGRSIVSLGTRFQAYGLIGGVLVLTLWVWLLGLIYYFGVAYSVVLATEGSMTAESFGLRLGLIQEIPPEENPKELTT